MNTSDFVRADGRRVDEPRPLSFVRDYTEMAAGSVLVSFGRTKVLCTASIEEDVPRWLRGTPVEAGSASESPPVSTRRSSKRPVWYQKPSL